MTWTDEGQDNRVHKDAVETIEKVIQSAKTILADEFAIQQMEYDELYGVNSKEYVAYQNLVTNYLNHRGLLADLDAGKLLAPGTGTPRPPAPVGQTSNAFAPAPAPMPHSSDPNLPAPSPQAAFPSQSMAMFEQQVEGFNDSIFEAAGARSSLEFNPNATPPPPEERGSLPIPPDAEPPRLLTVPTTKADYDPEFLPLQPSIHVDEQVANAAAMIASAEPDPSYASGSWSIPSQIQAPLPAVPAPQPVETDPYGSGAWAALAGSTPPAPLDQQTQVQAFAQMQPPAQAPSPWAPIAPPQPEPMPAPAAAPLPADYNPWNPLPGSAQTPAPAAAAFVAPEAFEAPGAQQEQEPQTASGYATDPNADKWETGGWATISTPSNGAGSGAANGGTGSAFPAPDPAPAPTVFQWSPPEQNQYQAQPLQASNEEEEKKKEDNSAFTFDPTKAWE